MKQLTVERRVYCFENSQRRWQNLGALLWVCKVDPFASHTARVDFKLGLNTYHRKKSIAEDGNS